MAQLINEQQELLPGYELILHVRDDACNGDESSKIFLQEITDNPAKFIALAGTGCSGTSKSTATIAPVVRMPHISWGSVAADLSDREVYPTFFRTRVPETSSNLVWHLIAASCGWKKLVVIKGEDTRFGYQATTFLSEAAQAGIEVPFSSSVLVPADAERAVTNIMEHRVKIVVAISYEPSIEYLMCEAVRANVSGLIIITKTHGDRFWRSHFVGMHAVCTQSAMDAVAEHMVMVGGIAFRDDVANLTCVSGMTSADYQNWWNSFKEEHTGTALLPTAHSAAANAADGVCMLALAMRVLLAQGLSLEALRARTEEAFTSFNEAFAATVFEGVSGHIAFPPSSSGNGAGDPLGPSVIYQVQNATVVEVGSYEAMSKLFSWDADLVWPGGSCPGDSFEECHPGWEPSGSSCIVCAVGRYKADSGSQLCSLCQEGLYTDQVGATACQYCPHGQFGSDHGMSECSSCPYGHTANDSGLECRVDILFFTCGVSVMLFVLLSATTLFRRLRRSLKIVDMTLDNGQLIVTTFGHHLIWHSWRRASSTCVRLSGTGCPELDRPGRCFRVRVLSSQRLELLTEKGLPIGEDWATSKGLISQPFPLELMDTTSFIRRVPAFLSIVLSFLAAGMAALLGHLDILLAVVAESVGVIIAAMLSLSARSRYHLLRTPIEQAISNFRDSIFLDRPRPQPSERGAGRAITAEQLLDFMEFFQAFIKHRNMYYVCENLVMPLTAADRLSYADLVGPSPLQWFVSHYWGSPFREFTEIVRKHSENLELKASSYWICTFSINQWEVQTELGSQIEDSSFYKALRSQTCRGTVMVIDSDASTLRRVWCLFEVATTYQRTKEDPTFEGLFLCTQTGVLNRGAADMDAAIQIAKLLLKLDLKTAKATDENDKDRILALVSSMEGGFKAVNGFVREAIRNKLYEMHQVFEENFENIVSTLQKSWSRLSHMISADAISDESGSRQSSVEDVATKPRL